MARVGFNLILDSGLLRSSSFKEKHIYTLYTLSVNNYFAHTYPVFIIIYKVKQKSAVDGFTWEQLAKGRTMINEMDLVGHLDPVAAGNEFLWINGLENYLEKAREAEKQECGLSRTRL